MQIHTATLSVSFFASISIGARTPMSLTGIDVNTGLSGTVSGELIGQTILKSPINGIKHGHPRHGGLLLPAGRLVHLSGPLR